MRRLTLQGLPSGPNTSPGLRIGFGRAVSDMIEGIEGEGEWSE